MRVILFSFVAFAPAVISASWKEYCDKPREWFGSGEAAAVAANVLAWQSERGDWPGDVDTFGPRPADATDRPGTFDDGHTTDETRFLARMYASTGREEYRDGALRAIDHVIGAQYATGGFPQRYPPGEDHSRFITFNDGVTVCLLELMRDVAAGGEFGFVDDGRRRVAGKVVEAGLRAIVALQYQGQRGLAAWAAQYDEETLRPATGRAFEPAALASAESADVLVFLMSFEEPGPEVVRAVEVGVNWFRRTQINGLRVVEADGDVRVVEDRSAPPVWARFYDFDTERPVFAGRDGVVRRDLAEIERERRVGYAWYGNWGSEVFEAYERWPYRARRGR